MVRHLLICLAIIMVAAIGCTATITLELEVDRPLAVTIDSDGGGS